MVAYQKPVVDLASVHLVVAQTQFSGPVPLLDQAASVLAAAAVASDPYCLAYLASSPLLGMEVAANHQPVLPE